MTRRPARAAARALACAALALLAAIAPAGPARAAGAEIQFTASVDRTTVGLGEQLQLNLDVRGENMLTVPTPALPAMPDFTVVGSSSSQSTNISFINGQMKREATVTFMYGLAAKRLGRLVIPPCKLVYQGQEYRTQPIEVTVTKAPQGQAAPLPQAQAPGGAGGGEVPVEGNLALLATPSRRTCYQGEPVVLEISVATRLRMAGGGWAAAPSFDGFWAEKIFDADRFDFQRRTIDGRAYDVSLLKKVALFPVSSGDVTIPAIAFNAQVVQAPRDPFGFFGSTAAARVESKPITIHVLPLPDAGRPSSFTGGVGRFTMTASLDRPSSANSEPVNLTVRIAGTGNVKLIEKPALAPVTGLRILDPEIKDDTRVTGDEVHGTKTLRYPVIPQADGKYEIPAIELAYFDPQAKAYRTLSAGPFTFSASGVARSSAPLVEATGLKVLGSDIAWIKPDATSLPATPLEPPAWPAALYVLAAGSVGGAGLWRSHRDRLQSDRGYARKVRSSGLVRRRLRQAETLLRKRDEKGFHAALAQAVTGYVGDRFDLDAHALTKEQLRAELERRQVRPEAAAAVMDVLATCETARFSPGALPGRDPAELFRRAREALGQL